MGVGGVRWECKTSLIIEQLKKAQGKVTLAAKSMNICFDTLKRRINEEPELQKALKEIREQFNEDLLDSAENVLHVLASRLDNDPNHAIKSAFYILNNKGKERGYSPYNNPSATPPHDKNIDKDHENIILQNRIRELEAQLANGSKPETN